MSPKIFSLKCRSCHTEYVCHIISQETLSVTIFSILMTSSPCGHSRIEKHMFLVDCLGEVSWEMSMELAMIRIKLAMLELVITRKVDSLNSHYQDYFITTLFWHFTAEFILLLLPFVRRAPWNVSKWNLVFIFTWMSFADRLRCEQERCIVFHFVAIVMISIRETVRSGFWHFVNFF